MVSKPRFPYLHLRAAGALAGVQVDGAPVARHTAVVDDAHQVLQIHHTLFPTAVMVRIEQPARAVLKELAALAIAA